MVSIAILGHGVVGSGVAEVLRHNADGIRAKAGQAIEVKRILDLRAFPDLPYADYMADYKAIADRYDLKMIMLITPETSEERVRLIDAHTSGFIYMVSSAATTGAQQSFNEQKQAYFRRINAMNLRNPRLVGFGISNKATFEAAASNSSGAIIGSKFVQLLKSEPTIAGAVDQLLEALKH